MPVGGVLDCFVTNSGGIGGAGTELEPGKLSNALVAKAKEATTRTMGIRDFTTLQTDQDQDFCFPENGPGRCRHFLHLSSISLPEKAVGEFRVPGRAGARVEKDRAGIGKIPR